MSANSMPQTPKLNDWLKSATILLSDADIDSAQLDSELILCKTLDCNRTFLHAHPEYTLTNNQQSLANELLARRLNREPIAYLYGKKEFYGRDFIVSGDTLIPRPESEQIIESLIESFPSKTEKYKFIDVGTGSGCLGITARLERLNSDVMLVDISDSALEIAILNADRLDCQVTLKQNNLLDGFTDKFDAIIANLPYVDETWERSPETEHEPSLALFATDNGLYLIKKLLLQSKNLLKNNGKIFIECDVRQHKELLTYAEKLGYTIHNITGLIVILNASTNTVERQQ